MNVFEVKCRVIQWVDADTVEIHPLINPYGVNVRARLKDKWAPERNEAGHDVALRRAKDLLGAGGEASRDYVTATNTRHERTQSRIEMRLDPA